MRITIGQHIFEHVCRIEPELNEDGLINQTHSHYRYRNRKNLPLHRYGRGPFCKFRIPKGHEVSGVYAITVGRIVNYIGECQNLTSRFNSGYGQISPRNCFTGGQETNCRINSLVLKTAKNGGVLSLWFMETEQHKICEQALRHRENPPWNRT